MSRMLNENDIINILWGAALLGGGGGGSLFNGIDVLDKYKREHPDTTIEVELCSVDDMKPGAYAAVTAGLGAPAKFMGVDFSKYATNAFNALADMAAGMGRKLEYSLSVELGGSNTLVPMLISMANGIPLIDSDGAARAVPSLDSLLLHINGCDTSPLAMASDENDKLTIHTSDPRDAKKAESIVRYICMAFDMISGLSGWMVQKDDWRKNDKGISRLPRGTISLSGEIGKVLRESKATGAGVFDELKKSVKGFEGKFLCQGEITDVITESRDGFDYGEIYINSCQENWVCYFQNENLIISKNGDFIMTAPDIICTLETESRIPLTNADVKKGMDITIGVIKVDEAWDYNPDMYGVWAELIKEASDYDGGRIPFEKV